MRYYLTVFNHATMSLFGSIKGKVSPVRGAVVGGGLGAALYLGVPAVTGYFRGEPVLLDGRVVIGVCTLTVVVTEGVLWYFGNEPGKKTEETVAGLQEYCAKLETDNAEFDRFVKASNIERYKVTAFMHAIKDARQDAEVANKPVAAAA